MNRSAFDKKKNHVAILFGILLIVTIGVGVYLFFVQSWARSEIDALVNADYTNVYVEKGESDDMFGLPLSQKSEYSSAIDIFHTPLGFPIVSFSQEWTGDKLEEIYDELIANKHGKEISSVSEVLVYAGESAQDSGGNVAGTHVTSEKTYSLFFDLPGLVPETLEYNIDSTQSTIELYNMDKYDSAQQVARTISHEYGHHYTMYYFMQDDESTKNSEYYHIRGIGNFDHDVFFEIESEYYENHMWSIYEIAAEDYVQLMGSPTAKQQIEYLDIYEALDYYYKNKENYTVYADASVSNVYPQENIYIPLADEVNGLREYYLSFIGETSELDDLVHPNFNISMTQHDSYGYDYYEITWDKTTDDPDALYTLVCYSSNGDIFLPVRTVYGDEKPIARIGTAVKLSGITISTSSDKITDEDRFFKLYVTWPDGRMQSSEVFYADF